MPLFVQLRLVLERLSLLHNKLVREFWPQVRNLLSGTNVSLMTYSVM
jgi:hypothetical protein